MKVFLKVALLGAAALAFAACEAKAPTRPDFDQALEAHLGAIQARDLDAFAATLTGDDALYMIFPNGDALTAPADAVAMHREWFADPDWILDGEVVRKIVGADMALALIKYDYRDTVGGPARAAWLALVFRLEDGQWRLVHDQNTRIAASTEE